MFSVYKEGGATLLEYGAHFVTLGKAGGNETLQPALHLNKAWASRWREGRLM